MIFCHLKFTLNMVTNVIFCADCSPRNHYCGHPVTCSLLTFQYDFSKSISVINKTYNAECLSFFYFFPLYLWFFAVTFQDLRRLNTVKVL